MSNIVSSIKNFSNFWIGRLKITCIQTSIFIVINTLIFSYGWLGCFSCSLLMSTISFQELRGYMLKHGGHFENYFSRRRVTHIICSNLPDSKVKNLRSAVKQSSISFLFCISAENSSCNFFLRFVWIWYRSFSRGLPVVKPTWVLDSVAANKLLNCKFILLWLDF